MARYDSAFFRSETFYAMTSAAEIVPHVMELVSPTSVVDLGCGSGGWLAVFGKHGVEDIQGYDGDWVDPDLLQIDRSHFEGRDLRKGIKPNRAYDLAVCLETGEHLPEESAEILVGSLTSLAPVVLFSAAIPGQGGTGHSNEQWQSWWAGRFAQRGYVPVDCLRHRIWNNPKVCHWYCQNLLIYVDRRRLAAMPALAAEWERSKLNMLDLVHPRMFILAETSFPRLVKRALTAFPRAFEASAGEAPTEWGAAKAEPVPVSQPG